MNKTVYEIQVIFGSIQRDGRPVGDAEFDAAESLTESTLTELFRGYNKMYVEGGWEGTVETSIVYYSFADTYDSAIHDKLIALAVRLREILNQYGVTLMVRHSPGALTFVEREEYPTEAILQTTGL